MTNLHLGESSNPPYDESLKEEIEQRLGIHLPASYIDLLKSWNGGYFPATYEIRLENPVPALLQDYLGEGFWGLSSLPGIARDASAECNLMGLIENAGEWGLPAKVVPSFPLAANFAEVLRKLFPHEDVYDEEGNIIYKP